MTFRRVSRKAVLAIHSEQPAQHGGLSGLWDEALLASALARPQNLAAYEHPSPGLCAAAYVFGIVRNHPFNDGNKRTGFIIAVTFLLLNGFYMNASEADVVLVIMQLADGSLTEEALALWFEEVIVLSS